MDQEAVTEREPTAGPAGVAELVAQMVGAAQDLLTAAHVMARLNGVEVPPSPMEERMALLEQAVTMALVRMMEDAQRPRVVQPLTGNNTYPPAVTIPQPAGKPWSPYTRTAGQPWTGLSGEQIRGRTSAIQGARSGINCWPSGFRR